MKTICYGDGEYWLLHANGAIERPRLWKPSDAWRVIGAVERNNFGNVVRRYTLQEILTTIIPWQFKNGKQRVFVCDADHGTRREWRAKHSIQ